MPDDTSTGSTKPQTRSHTRYSLASVGKALGMNKDSSKDTATDKSAKRSKETAARRSSVTAPTSSSRGRASVGEKSAATNPPTATAPTTRASRRQSALPTPTLETPSEDSATPTAKDAPTPPMTRAASLRPRKAGNPSALPKYRPRSVHLEQALKKPPAASPQKSSRRKLSSSEESWEELEDEKKGKKVTKSDDESSEAIPDKAARPISPPSGRAPKTSVNITLSPSPSVNKVQIPRRDSPNGPPVKATTKKSSTPTPQSPPSGPARPPSSSSSSSSVRSPRSPQTPTAARAAKSKAVPIDTSVGKGSPLRHAVKGSHDSGHRQKAGSATPTSMRSIFNEGNSLESIDAADVEYMLGSGASPTAPTPAVPRIRKGRTPDEVPQTPSRQGSTLPSRQNMSYLSPMPPTRDDSPSKRSLRPAGNDRGSLLSWDQLVAVGDMTLGEGEADSMIADMAAPFSGPSSPALSTISLPECDSPSLSTMPSPAGYGSISQILLPEVTPSPAKHAFGTPGRIRGNGNEGGMATMLKLQLASMEQIAKERLGQIQALEQQLQSAKQARLHETTELARQMALLEEQTRHALEARDRASEDQAGNIVALEEQLDVAISVREQAVKNAAKRAAENAEKERDKTARAEARKKDMFCAAKGAEMGWGSVKDVAMGEVEFVKASREMLGVLLAGLEVSRMHIVAAPLSK